jgi:Pyruvate/2-oxoacid:ferredoxin oxidoreductase delta subunit
MAGKKLTVVISQTQSKNPAQRRLEEDLATALLFDKDVDVSLVPNLYDLSGDHSGMLFLRSAPGDLVILAWLFPRASRWILDRNGVKGQIGESLLNEPDDDDEEPAAERDDSQALGAWNVPNRRIYCIDLRDHTEAQVYLDEIHRIARECAPQQTDLLSWIQGQPNAQQLERYLHPDKLLAEQSNGNGHAADDQVRRRWYPVIDYSRCTNCMECIDFCLFGVYGVDGVDRILVEQQDNCKKGCPACSRVCPANAIMFPQHKTPEIAGAEGGEVTGLKIDLSKLFGAPSALELAAQERDVELVADGREAVGMTVGIPKRQEAAKAQPRDALDDLMDGLDAL